MQHTATAETDAATDDAPLRIAIIVGSTRPGRLAETVARWVRDLAEQRTDVDVEIIDIADYALPHFDESLPPLAGQYSQPHTLRWAATIDAFDAYIFVTPEYNHATSGALKNAIDFLFAEWNDKAAAFVSYGVDGGVRAVEQLRLVLGELKVADVRAAVALSVFDDFEQHTTFTPSRKHDQAAASMLDDLLPWAAALKTVRTSAGRLRTPE
jgi:NAD(P)H-dependent FMN reductase